MFDPSEFDISPLHRPTGWIDEVRVTFDRDELDDFFDGFAPMDTPTDLLDRLFATSAESSLSCAA